MTMHQKAYSEYHKQKNRIQPFLLAKGKIILVIFSEASNLILGMVHTLEGSKSMMVLFLKLCLKCCFFSYKI